MANKRKTTTAIVAGVTALALLLGGTFAWTSISQQARNEAIVDINPGGRLHDDFNGTNKDVYVENFGDETTGVPIYARIRLDQYFEVGQDAGINKTETDRKVTQVLGTDINKVETWVTYTPTLDENGSINFDALQANGNWTWDMGNGEDNLPYYMPTFNKNKDSLAADINGTYEGKTEGDIVHYDDYVVYVDAEGNPKTVAGTEVYDWDDENADEEPNPDITYDDTTPRDSANVYHKTKNDDGTDLTHTAKQIDSTATVITMQQWINDYNSQPGPYWVYDTDGWAYWAQPIKPGETTGLLLDSINMSRVPDDNWYYGINVVGQFATKGDIYQFEDMTPEAEKLFGIVTDQEESVVITGADTIFSGNTATYSATRMVLGTTAANQPSFVWTATATDAEGNAVEGITMNNGELTVADTVAGGTQITVTATATDGTATATEGEESTTQTLAGSKTVTVITIAGTATVTAENGFAEYDFGGTTTGTFTAAVEGATNGTFTWSVTDGDGNKATDATVTADATDSSKATLTVGANEIAEKLIVTATFKSNDSAEVYIGTCEISRNVDISTTDDLAATPYALLFTTGDESEMVFIRTYDTITDGISTYNGKSIARYMVVDEVQGLNLEELTDEDRGLITNVTFANTIKPKSAYYAFAFFQSMNEIDFNDKLDLSDVTDLSHMFEMCTNLAVLDMSGLNLPIDKLLDFSRAFDTCTGIHEIIFPANIKLSNLESCFRKCYNLDSVTNLDTWNVSEVENFSDAFSECWSLTSLDISNWDTSNATDMSSMFADCEKLELDCSGWDVAKVDVTVDDWGFSGNKDFNTNAPGVKAPTWPEPTTE